MKNQTQNVVENLFPYSFPKNQNWAYLWINSLFYIFIFTACQVKNFRNTLKPSCAPLAFIPYKAFLKNKKGSETGLYASFSTCFLEKSISLVSFYYLTKFDCLVASTLEDIGQYGYRNCLLTRLWRHNFWN